MSLSRLIKWKYSPSLIFSGANTFFGVVFQLGALYKMGVGSHSDLYYASILLPTVLYALAFGALNNVLVPMFVEAKARGDGEEAALLWNCLFVTVMGGLILLAVMYYPMVVAFPLLFRKLAWLDLGQVSGVLVTFSLYQVLYIAVTTKNCFLFAQGRPVSAQAAVFCGWAVSLSFLSRFHEGDILARIPLCLAAGYAIALLFPNLEKEAFRYRLGLLKRHTISIVSRTLPVTAGTSVGWVEPAIDGVVASTLKQGSLTIYYFFGRMMFYIVTSIFSGYIQPVTKHLAELAGSGQWRELRRRTNSVAVNAGLVGLGLSVCGLLVFLILGTLKISVLRPYVLTFGQNLPVFFLLLGYLFGALGYVVYSNSLYILRRERLFLFASFTSFSIGILLKLSGAWAFGLRGLAAGTSLYWMTYAIVLLFCFSWAVRRRQADTLPATFSPALQEHGD